MIIAVLIVLGLCMGSFVNALVWRLHEQELSKSKNKSKKRLGKLSITKGRSMCPNCRHELAVRDLIPVLSWLSLRGKCRYCKKPISAQYPIVEIVTSALFVLSYITWPTDFDITQLVLLALWLEMMVGLMALFLYDARWMILPDKIVMPLGAIAGAMAFITVISSSNPLVSIINVILSVAVGGGIFYVLFQVSDGKWIGGGDVKLGWVIGLFLATPARSFLMIFIAALLGCLISIPLLFSHKLKRTSIIPFGPFLIVSAVIVQLYGQDILNWYQSTFLSFAG